MNSEFHSEIEVGVILPAMKCLQMGFVHFIFAKEEVRNIIEYSE